ncbi:DUF6119 family protein [Dactylosporangium fulvum]|uniref:TIGR04141 family sporadically distributed protein n=1 Tax=Dactylosporangium fulvum TaxID=53359 RepID=A0ABY5WDN0_9ACTN|nr:DUF6119 family protein [Dactylosporangium fulvum]UWP87451.1 TIGR04141 family sporadically distributed protein [Dactylosporangium fulvum]
MQGHWLRDADRRYILTLGRWFALVESYTQQLDADLSKIEDVTALLNPPAWPASFREGQYNTRFHRSRPGDTIVLDTVDIRSEDGDEIEACDLLDRSGRLIHIKNYKKSQTLSHLFSQGLVSAISLRRDPTYQANFRRVVEGLDPAFTQIAERAPEVVVYAIAVRDQRSIPAGLPSFSKVNLRDFTKRVQIAGARPAICRIQIVDDSAA